MDLNFLRDAAMWIFCISAVLEYAITAKLLVHSSRVALSARHRICAILIGISQSSWNLNAAWEVYNNQHLGEALITKLGYCIIGLLWMILLFFIFKEKWGFGVKK